MNDKTARFLQDNEILQRDFNPDDFRILVDYLALKATPELIALMFASMDAEGQALFFNHVDRVASCWHGGRGALCFQLQAITNDHGLTLAGRRVMQEIGEYSHWGLVPSQGELT